MNAEPVSLTPMRTLNAPFVALFAVCAFGIAIGQADVLTTMAAALMGVVLVLWIGLGVVRILTVPRR